MISLLKERYQSLRLSIRHLNRIEPNVMIFVVYGMLYDMMLNLHSPFAAKYLDRLGGGTLAISLLNSLPGLVAVFVLLPGLLIIRRFPAKKKVTAVFFFLSRVFLLLIAFVPLMPAASRPIAFLVFFSVMNIPGAVSQSSLQSFLGTVFDGRMRSTALSMRTKFGNIIIPLTTLTTGLIISYLPLPDEMRLVVYQVFFVAAFIVGLFEIAVFLRFNEKKEDITEAERIPLRKQLSLIADTLRDKTFRRYLATVLLFYAAWHSGWALGSIYFIKELRANEFWLAMFIVTAGLGSFLTAGRWNRLIQRHGNHIALILSALGLALNMFLYLLCKNVYTMTLCQIFSGTATTGFSIAVLNGLLNATPDKNRILYIGVFNTLLNISLATAPLFAQFFIDRVGTHWTLVIVGSVRFITVTPLVLYFLRQRKANAAAPQE